MRTHQRLRGTIAPSAVRRDDPLTLPPHLDKRFVTTSAVQPDHPLRIAVAASLWYEDIMEALIRGARDTFADSGDLTVIRCPGTWELPSTIMAMHERLDPTPDAYVALGCVIKGDTSHDRWINQAVCNTLAELSVFTGVPIALGVLTCDTMAQAQARAGGSKGNKGIEAMNAVLSQIHSFRSISWNSNT